MVDPLIRWRKSVLATILLAIGLSILGCNLSESSEESAFTSYSNLFDAQIGSGHTFQPESHRLGNQIRDAVSTPGSYTLSFHSLVPPNAELAFAHGIKATNPEQAKSKYVFLVLVRDAANTVTALYEKEVSCTNVWIDGVVRLEEYASQSIEIILQVLQKPDSQDKLQPIAQVKPVWGQVSVREKIAYGTPPPPSILWIVIDTLRADHLSCYDYERSTTPFIDKLAKRGIVYEQAFSHSPWTRTSVGSMLTSAYANQICTGPCDGLDFWIGKNSPPSIMKVLESAGYRNAAFINNAMLDVQYGCNHWFPHYFTAGEDTRAVLELNRWLEQQEKQTPFIAYLHLLGSHLPYNFVPGISDKFIDKKPGEELSRQYVDRGDFYKRPPSVEELDGIIKLYDGKIYVADQHVKQIVDKLRKQELLDNTILVIASDHGEEFNDHGGWEHGHTFYDEQLHVPLIIVPPQSKHGERIGQMVRLIDIAPTLLALTDVAPPPSFIGEKLPLSPSEEDNDDRILFAENPLYGSQDIAFRSSSLKYIFGPEQRSVFDLIADPDEKHNLADQPQWLAKGAELRKTFWQDFTGDKSSSLVHMKFQSQKPTPWNLVFHSNTQVRPLIANYKETGVLWSITEDDTGSVLSFTTSKDVPLYMQLPLFKTTTSLAAEITVEDRPLQTREIFTPGPYNESLKVLLGNLHSEHVQKELFATHEPTPPQTSEKSLSIWVSEEDMTIERVRADDTELKKRLQQLGYIQ